MNLEVAIQMSLELVDRSALMLLGTHGPDGFPSIRAMLKLESEGLQRVWFSSNRPARHVANLERDHRACLYFLDDERFIGLELAGTITLRSDPETRQRLWRDGFELYYPRGVDDPDYLVLLFTAEQANLYYRLDNLNFEV